MNDIEKIIKIARERGYSEMEFNGFHALKVVKEIKSSGLERKSLSLDSITTNIETSEGIGSIIDRVVTNAV